MEYKIVVKNWMTNYDTFMDSNSILMQLNSSPMPMCIMYGNKIKETEKMVLMDLYADVKEKVSVNCIKCGKKLTNDVSKLLGIGPECGKHHYVNPFETDEDLEKAINEIKTQLKEIKWSGWILKSGIIELNCIDSSEDEIQIEPVKIKIDIEKSNKCNGEYSAYVSFDYDNKVVNIIREMPSRNWDIDTKRWEVPIRLLDTLKEKLKDYDLNITDSYDVLDKPILDKSTTNYIPNDYKFKNEPFKHQIEGINYGLANDKFLLGDEQGLGKTMQVINIACINKQLKEYKHCLIVCGVNGLKWNWKAEIEKHSNEHGYILGTRYAKNGKSKIGSLNDRLDDLNNIDKINQYFIITNIETLRNEQIISKLKELCDKKIINMIALDEGHKCKDPTSQQGKALLKLQTDTMISMTGTPLMNNPLDLYIHLKWLGYEKHNYYQFKQHYCVFGGFGGYQIQGYKNLDQLKFEFENIILRRLKKDVLDLPEKLYSVEYVEMTPKQQKIYNEVTLEVKENIDKISNAVNPLAEMIRMRQATDYTGILSSTIKESAKLDRLEEILNEIVANGKKAIIFSNWTSMTTPTYERFKHFNPAIITGETKDRVEQQDKFMNDASCKIIIGTTGAMGTGLTLTAATTVIFLDEPWNRALREQAEDRAHRIGTTENINIIYMLCKDTIDERIHELIEQKGQLADLLVDGKVNSQSKTDLVNFLLS